MQCRCGAFIWSADVTGTRVTVEPVPLPTADAVLSHLVAGQQIFQVVNKAGKPDHLRWLGLPGTVWEPSGRVLVASHPCPTGAAKEVEIPAQGPPSAPVTPGSNKGGNPLAAAPADGSQGQTAKITTPGCSTGHPNPAGHAIRPRSDEQPLRRAVGPRSPSDGPGDQPTPQRPSEAPWDSGKRHVCPTPSPTESAGGSGPAAAGPTAPGVTRRSAPTGPVTATASARTASTGAARIPQTSASFAARTESGAIRPATTHSRRPMNCAKCGKLVRDHEPYTAIEHGRAVWAMHDYDCVSLQECSMEFLEKYWKTIRDLGHDVAVELKEKGLTTRPINTLELP